MVHCANCGEFLPDVLECVTEVITHEGENFCSTDCKEEHFEMEECVFCEEMAVCEHYDERETYEGRTCSQDCHNEAMYLWGRNHGDPNHEHRTY